MTGVLENRIEDVRRAWRPGLGDLVGACSRLMDDNWGKQRRRRSVGRDVAFRVNLNGKSILRRHMTGVYRRRTHRIAFRTRHLTSALILEPR